MLIGESCVDEYHYGTCNRISPEAPVPIFDFSHKIQKCGMASNVKQNLESFGCSVDFITNDSNNLIKRRFVDLKTNQQLLREDISMKLEPVSFSTSDKQYDVVVISDYDKGFLDFKTIDYICNNYKNIFVDTKKKDLASFYNCFIKFNYDESKQIVNYGKECNYIVTKGKHGAHYNGVDYKAPIVDISDVTGAGDVFLSVLSVLYTVTNDIDESIKKSIILASESVKHNGVYKLTERDINEICD